MDARPLNLVRPEVPVELAAVVAKMMAKEPGRRFQTPGEVAQALTPFFKKGSVAVKGAKPEISQAGQPEAKQATPGAVSVPPRPAAERTPAPVSAARKPAPTQPGSILEGLIDLRETEPLFDTMLDGTPPAAAPKPSQRAPPAWSTAVEKLSRLGPRAWWAAAGVLLLGLVVAWAAWSSGSRPPRRSCRNMPDAGSSRRRRGTPPRSGADGTISGSIKNSIGMTLKLIPAGEFMMGSPDGRKDADADENPQHRVRISKPFYLGVYEVTQAQYEAVMGNNPSYFSANGGRQGQGRRPVDRPLSGGERFLADAIQFCNKLSEKEGKKPFYEIEVGKMSGFRTGTGRAIVCRRRRSGNTPAGRTATTRFSFGDDAAELGRIWVVHGNSDGRTHPVGQKRPNGFGLYDMHGNVWEWCWDWYGEGLLQSVNGGRPTGPGRHRRRPGANLASAAVSRNRRCRVLSDGRFAGSGDGLADRATPGLATGPNRVWPVSSTAGEGAAGRRVATRTGSELGGEPPRVVASGREATRNSARLSGARGRWDQWSIAALTPRRRKACCGRSSASRTPIPVSGRGKETNDVPTTENPVNRTRTVERSGTLIETDDDIRQAFLSGHKGRQPGQPVAVDPPAPRRSLPPPATRPPARSAVPFRPTVRPPVAVLTVFDDGKTDGEIIRIRDHRFIIGRTEGDLCIPLDGRISARHVEITHQVVGGLHRWVVTDLQSTHGMFVRVSRTVLADKAEFLVGNGRYRFDAPQADAGPTVDHVPNEARLQRNSRLDEGASPFRPPAVTELLGTEIGNRMLLVKNEYWIGSDPTCPICRPDDPFCEPRHVRLYRGGSRGGWHAEHNKTPQRALAADAADHGRIDGPVPDRRATVSAQGVIRTGHGSRA